MATTATQAFRRTLLPAARTVYEQWLGRLTRPNRKGWSIARCPFHQSRSGKSFAVHIDGAFFCFGCGVKGGDIVAFVRLRDHCDFPTACKLLGAWQNVSEEERLNLASEAARRKRERDQANRVKVAKRAQRLELRGEIHCSARIQRETSDRLSQLLQGAVENYPQEQEHRWSTLALCLDDLRETEAQYMSSMRMEYL